MATPVAQERAGSVKGAGLLEQEVAVGRPSRMARLTQYAGRQTAKPSGAAGAVGAGLMLLLGPSSCKHRQVAALLALQPDDVLLDVACGSGLFLRRRAQHVRHLAGVDHSRVQVALARLFLRRRLHDGTAEIVQADAALLPWPDGAFSAVSCNSLGCVVEAERVLAEMLRVLRPGGRLAIATDYCPDDAAARRRERDWGWRGWTLDELRSLLEQAGFAQIRLSHDDEASFAHAVKPGQPLHEIAPGSVAKAGAFVGHGINAQGQKPTGLLGWVVATVMGPLFVPVNARVGRLLDLQPDDSVLDVACGSGWFLRWQARHAARVAGLDHSAIQIRMARRLLRGRVTQGTAEVVLGDAAELPWPDGQFSAAACNCLDCFAMPREALAEVHRVLRPGGRVVIGIDSFDDPDEARRSTHKSGLPAWTEPELIALVTEAGFEAVATSRGAGMTFALAVRR